MKSNISEIQEIVQAIEVTPQRQVLLYGQLFGGEFSDPYLQQPSNKMLFETLQNLIYTVFYCRNMHWQAQAPTTEASGMPSSSEVEQFMKELSEENSTLEILESGWVITHIDEQGMITAQKGNYTRRVYHGEYLNESVFNQPPIVQQQIRIWSRKEYMDVSTGFYYLFGSTLAEDNLDQTVRIYFNIAATGIKELVRSVSELFNKYQIPFHFKCLNHPIFYTRSDAAVLYFEKRYSTLVFTVLEKIYELIKSNLKTEIPLFTRQLGKGIAFAENPRKMDESFGTHVSKMLAQGIMNAILKRASKTYWLTEIKANLEQQHQYKNIEQLYLNYDSRYPYKFPQLN